MVTGEHFLDVLASFYALNLTGRTPTPQQLRQARRRRKKYDGLQFAGSWFEMDVVNIVNADIRRDAANKGKKKRYVQLEMIFDYE